VGSIGSETTSGLRHILGVLGRWWILLLIGTAFALSMAALAVLTAPQRFHADAQVLLSQPSFVNEPAVARETVQKLNDLMPTFAAVATSDPVLDAVRTAVSVSDSLDELRADIAVRPLNQTLILTIEVQREDRGEAEAIAEALVEQFAAKVTTITEGEDPGGAEVVARQLRAPDVDEVPQNRVRTLLVALVLGFGLSAVAAFALDRS
jgi:capsular polysaccharide biosynthesis protein